MKWNLSLRSSPHRLENRRAKPAVAQQPSPPKEAATTARWHYILENAWESCPLGVERPDRHRGAHRMPDHRPQRNTAKMGVNYSNHFQSEARSGCGYLKHESKVQLCGRRWPPNGVVTADVLQAITGWSLRPRKFDRRHMRRTMAAALWSGVVVAHGYH